jgi:hypothetical protein
MFSSFLECEGGAEEGKGATFSPDLFLRRQTKDAWLALLGVVPSSVTCLAALALRGGTKIEFVSSEIGFVGSKRPKSAFLVVLSPLVLPFLVLGSEAR